MEISLHIPSYGELWYRQKLLADPATMSYNRGYDLDFASYDRETGCIAFPETRWREFWDDWCSGQDPRRFYAYVMGEDGRFLGEVDLHRSGDEPWYEMGVVLEAAHRGKGYGRPALELLLHHAFAVLKAETVRNCFEEERAAALKIHLAAGFREIGREDGAVWLECRRKRCARPV